MNEQMKAHKSAKTGAKDESPRRLLSHHSNQSSPEPSTHDIVRRAQADISSVSPGELQVLNRSIGARAVQRMVAQSRGDGQAGLQVQAKLTVGAADDPYEREADRIAAQVMSGGSSDVQAKLEDEGDGVAQRKAIPSISPLVQRRARDLSGSFDAGAEVEQQLARPNGGSPLPARLRSDLEPKYGADFSGVRVHADAQSDSLNRKLGAQAFTHKDHIYMSAGKYNPGSSSGKQLLAHELTHVVQQGGASQGFALQRSNTLQRKLYVGGTEVEEVAYDDVNDQPIYKDISAERQKGTPNIDVGQSEYRSIAGGNKVKKLDAAWKLVKGARPAIDQMGYFAKSAMKSRLKKWMKRNDTLDIRGAKAARVVFQKSEDRKYEDWGDVADALIGEQKSKKNKKKEQKLAKSVAKKTDFRNDLAGALRAVHAWVEQQENKVDIWQSIEGYKAKFRHWWPGKGNVKKRMANPVLNKVTSNWVIIHEVFYALTRGGYSDAFAEVGRVTKKGTVSMPHEQHRAAEIGAASGEFSGRHAVIEKNLWVKAARARNMPVGAGASNTTDILLAQANLLALSANQKKAIAWGAFVFWNKSFYQVEARGHTFHEIMDVATARTNGQVDYDPDAVNPYDAGYNKKNKQVAPRIDVDNIDKRTSEVIGESFMESSSTEEQLPDIGGKKTATKTNEKEQVDDTPVLTKIKPSEQPKETQPEVEMPQPRDVYILDKPITISTNRGDKEIPAGKMVMVMSVEDADTVRVESEQSAGSHRGETSAHELARNGKKTER